MRNSVEEESHLHGRRAPLVTAKEFLQSARMSNVFQEADSQMESRIIRRMLRYQAEE